MKRVLTEESVNPNLKNISFPWPCKTDIRAAEIRKEIQMGVKYPFTEIFNADSANPLGMGQKPLTFLQQVKKACMNGKNSIDLDKDLYPSDVKQIAKALLDNCYGGSIGAYSNTEGIHGVRKQIAKYLERRDGVPSIENDIFLTNGASEGIQILLELFNHVVSPKPPAILIPVPEYPLFSAAMAQHGIHQAQYYLDEEKQWSVDMVDLQRAVDKSRLMCDPKAIVIINPGNPGGYNMTREDIEEIIKFAYKENLFIISDEVYQQNIYNSDRPFISFKKVLYEMGRPYRDMQLASFMSASKGFMGECGIRIGFFELINVEDKVHDLLSKLLLIRICPSTLGQAVLFSICNPPQPGDPSYELFEKEKNDFLMAMKINVEYGNKMFNSVKGMSSPLVDCSMVFFPRIYLTNKALREARNRGLKPDEMYCLEMVEETGICTLPGFKFGQKPGTYHFRFAFLYPPDINKKFMDKIVAFHEKFMKKYAD